MSDCLTHRSTMRLLKPFSLLSDILLLSTTYQPCVKPKVNYNHTETYPKDFVKLCSLNITLSALHKIKLWILNFNLWTLFFELYSTTRIFAECSSNWAINPLGLRRNRTADSSVCYVCESIQISSLLNFLCFGLWNQYSPIEFCRFLFVCIRLYLQKSHGL